jgi:hypothetical protein
MTESVKPSASSSEPSRKSSRNQLFVAILILLLLALLEFQCRRCSAPDQEPSDQILVDSLRTADSLARLDSLRLTRSADSLEAFRQVLEDSLRRLDSLSRLDSLRKARLRRTASQFLSDSLAKARHRSDSLRLDSLSRLARSRSDTIPPHVFADPAPGVHPAPIDLAVLSEEGSATPLCGPDSTHLKECRNLVRVTDRIVLWIAAVDTAGNRAPSQRLEYVIDPNSSRCGPLRALVPSEDGSALCVDAYEHPNKPSLAPRTSVNWDEANAYCTKDGKRLCSVAELTSACKGEHGWSYPYGDRYIPSHCQDVEGALARSVAKPACRSWWGAYNLVGNAWEWSSTPSGSTFLAVGGTYSGGPEDKCGRTTRSFFKQNRYEAVGFRCCETLAAPPQTP